MVKDDENKAQILYSESRRDLTKDTLARTLVQGNTKYPPASILNPTA